MRRTLFALAAAGLLTTTGVALSQDAPSEDDYYRMITLPVPEGIVLETGAFDWLPGGRLAVCTRRGEIWMIDNALSGPPDDLKFTRFASGLHETLGLAHRDGWIYATQRGEITRLKDTDGDGQADVFETFNDDWGLSGDYHEYAFGSKFDADGNLWVALCLTGSFSSEVPFRGWALRITPDGTSIPTTSGIRSPGGIGMNAEGDMFYTDNQGPWNGTSSLKHLRPGSFVGHPAGNVWYERAPEMGPRPDEPESGSRMLTEAAKIPQLLPPAVYFPYHKMGQSASGIACDRSEGKFGPFHDQLFVGDVTHSTVMRVFLEIVDGRYQGVCFPFRKGHGSGTLALMQMPDGSMMVGGTNRGWGSRGTKDFALERLVWTGRLPFEVHEMRATPDGFELTFTAPVETSTAGDPASYRMSTYAYIYQSVYGSPEVDETVPNIDQALVAADGMSVRLVVDGLVPGHVHELHLPGVRSAEGTPLVHDAAYYTLNAIPAAETQSP